MKHCTYKLRLTGDEDIITFIKRYLPLSYTTIAEANAKRRAIAALFGGAVQASLVSVRRVPAKTVRRKLRI